MKEHRRKRLRDLELAATDRTERLPDWVYSDDYPPNATRKERAALKAEYEEYQREVVALGLGEFL